MLKRSIATLGWFFATWCTWELVAYFTGSPRIVGPILATAAALAIGLDPMRAIWLRGQAGSAGEPWMGVPAKVVGTTRTGHEAA